MSPTDLRPLVGTGEDFSRLEVTTKEVSTCIVTMQLILL